MNDFNVNELPSLDFDVSFAGVEMRDSTAGPVCIAVGVALGTLINQVTHE